MKEQQASLLSLPSELLCEIASQTDSQGLLALRLTCKHLSQVTKSRSLWLDLVAEIESKACTLRSFERAQDQCPLGELERWVLRRLKVRESLTSGSTADLPIRTRGCLRNRAGQPLQLLPGGRWMLFMNVTCNQIHAYDLTGADTNMLLEPRILLDVGMFDEEDGTRDIPSCATIWINPSKSGGLSFRTLMWRSGGPEVHGHATRASIYQVDMTADGELGHIKPKPLAVFRTREMAERVCMAISGSYMAEIRRYFPKRNVLVLYTYTDGDDYNTNRQVIDPIPLSNDPTYNPIEMYITVSGQIVVRLATGTIEIYPISQLRSHPATELLAPIHRVSTRAHLEYSSGIFSYLEDSWIVFPHQDVLKLIKIPHDSTLPITMDLGRVVFHERDFMSRIRPTASAFLRHDWSLDIVSYSWDPETLVSTFKTRRVEAVGQKSKHGDARGWFIWQFDVDAGRLVLFHAYQDDCMIVDIG